MRAPGGACNLLTMELTRVWRGAVKPEARPEHERFVEWLRSKEASAQYEKYFLTQYTLSQQGDELIVTMAAEEPPVFIRFLRNRRMWPDFWEFHSAERPGAGFADETVRVRWRRGPNPV